MRMIELTTGYLNFEQLDAEVTAIVDDLKAFGVDTVYISFGCGCNHDAIVQSEDIPVRVGEIARFIADGEVP